MNDRLPLPETQWQPCCFFPLWLRSGSLELITHKLKGGTLGVSWKDMTSLPWSQLALEAERAHVHPAGAYPAGQNAGKVAQKFLWEIKALFLMVMTHCPALLRTSVNWISFLEQYKGVIARRHKCPCSYYPNTPANVHILLISDLQSVPKLVTHCKKSSWWTLHYSQKIKPFTKFPPAPQWMLITLSDAMVISCLVNIVAGGRGGDVLAGIWILEKSPKTDRAQRCTQDRQISMYGDLPCPTKKWGSLYSSC